MELNRTALTPYLSPAAALAPMSAEALAHKRHVDIFARRPRRILVLYVGGTIGMKKNRQGALEPCAGYLTEETRKMGELKGSKEIAPFDIVEYEQLLDSSDMNSQDYLRIAADVQKHYDQYDGFLIAHGTDTMHYTASALSFLLHNLAKPVIVTGAMVPLAEPFNDARRNLIISMMIASNPKICEVCIFFNDQLFRGNRCDKVYHTYGAFQSRNYPALGVMEASRFVLKQRYLLPQPTGAMSVLSNLNGTVMVFDMIPDVDIDAILATLNATRPATMSAKLKKQHDTSACDGKESAAAGKEGGSAPASAATEKPLLDAAIFVLHGVGSCDGVVAGLLRRIGAVATRRHIVTVATQSEGQGTFAAAVLARLRSVAPSLVYTGDMTIAAAELKLMYLFGKGLTPEGVAHQMRCNLRGEMTPQTPQSSL